MIHDQEVCRLGLRTGSVEEARVVEKKGQRSGLQASVAAEIVYQTSLSGCVGRKRPSPSPSSVLGSHSSTWPTLASHLRP